MTVEKRREIYARLGVQLTHNRRAYAAERAAVGAMSLYMFCVLYTRMELLDGFIPEDVALSAWGRPESERGPQVEALCEVDLLERVRGGFRVVKYAEHNDTKDDVDTARERERVRKRALRARCPASVPRDSDGTETPCPDGVPRDSDGTKNDVDTLRHENPSEIRRIGARVSPPRVADVPWDTAGSPTDVPISISISSSPVLSSGSLTHAPERARVTDTPPTLAPLGDAPPPWWGAAVETVEATTGLHVPDRAAAWLEYRASRERKGWAPSQRDACGWLAAVARTDARQTRERRKSGPELTRQAVDLSAPWMRAAMGDDP